MIVDSNSACFDPNNMPQLPDENGFSHETPNCTTPPFTPIDHHLDHHHHHHLDHHHHHHDNHHEITINNPNNEQELDPSMELDQFHHLHIHNPHDLPNFTINGEPNNWNEMGFSNCDEIAPTTTTTDLLTLLHFPRSSFASSSSSSANLGFLSGELNPAITMADNPISYDPLFHLNLPPQPAPLLRDLMFQSLPNGYGGVNCIHQTGGINDNSSNSLFGGLDNNNEVEGNSINGVLTGIYQDGDYQLHSNGVFEFGSGSGFGEGKEGKCPKNFVTERQRRKNFNDKYQHLRSLVPSPTKIDRASIVGDAIDYIKELKRTVSELKLLVDQKRISNERVKRLKIDTTPGGGGGGGGGGEDHHVHGVDHHGQGAVKPDPDGLAATNELRSSWLQRKCKDTEFDVRIIDDEATIKLVQRKKINCLLSVSRTLDELELDLRYVAGGHVGDYYSYLFNTKICEGSSVYASAIADKLIEVVERQYAASTSSF